MTYCRTILSPMRIIERPKSVIVPPENMSAPITVIEMYNEAIYT
jgi:hypothetical protein